MVTFLLEYLLLLTIGIIFFLISLNAGMKEAQKNKDPKESATKETMGHSQQRCSAFNEKPGGQKVHTRTSVEKGSDASESNIEPPGLTGHDENKENGPNI
ncbi:MAG TPA: hypothetical protein VFS22_09440 [Flavisolibacter sp.]|nr:hypothetical protein [Flavisolibacter sp.]